MINLPTNFKNQVQQDPDINFSDFVQALQKTPPISIRLHPFKINDELANHNRVDWNKMGRYLPERPNFTHDPLFQAGTYYVQEASSMSLEYALAQIGVTPGCVAVDLCAAPGGKSTIIADFLHQKLDFNHILISNEIIKSRASILDFNLMKWGYSNQVVLSMDPSYISTKLPESADIVVADCPCSGEGLFRKDPRSREEWSTENVELCDLRQKRILHEAMKILKPGGHIIYSTCTYNNYENINQVDLLCEKYGFVSKEIKDLENFGVIKKKGKSGVGYQFYPHLTKGEGFFIALLQKPEGNYRKWKPSKKQKIYKKVTSDSIQLPKGLQQYETRNETIRILPEALIEYIYYIDNIIPIKNFGTPAGKLIKNKLIPDHALALHSFAKASYPSINVDRETAIAFMKRENLEIDCKKGWNLISYQDHGLGWIKNIGNRINNYFPNKHRILK